MFPAPPLSSNPPSTSSRHPATTSANAALARVVLEHLFNASDRAEAQPEARSTPTATVATLFKRMVEQRDFSRSFADLERLITTLEDAAASENQDPAHRLSNCSLGKVLHLLCHILRNRGSHRFDRDRLLHAAGLCGTLIAGKQRFLLETCGVIMFHLGELVTFNDLRPMCEGLICDHLAPRFGSLLLQGNAGAFTGRDVVFGLVATLRASELRIQSVRRGEPPGTPADALVAALHTVLERQPMLLQPCESATLGLLARQGVHYLLRLSAIGGDQAAGSPMMQRQYAVAGLIKQCIDEVNAPQPRAADVANRHPPQGEGGHLRHAVPYYNRWLNQQDPAVQALLALREDDHEPPFQCIDRVDETPTSRFSRTMDRLPAWDACVSGEARARCRLMLQDAYDEASLLIRMSGEDDAVDVRARRLLDLDTLYRHLELATPLGSSRYDTQKAALDFHLQEALAQLANTDGIPLLQAAMPSGGGLHSWQRLLLESLLP